jgi:hypothetical protein
MYCESIYFNESVNKLILDIVLQFIKVNSLVIIFQNSRAKIIGLCDMMSGFCSRPIGLSIDFVDHGIPLPAGTRRSS